MNIFATFLLSTAGTSGNGTTSSSPIPMIIMMAVLFGAMYLFTIRPQKKQQQKEQQLRESTQIGDEITTIGGICGKVVSIKDDTITIETGSDRTKLKIKKFAIGTNDTANAKIAAEREAAKKEAEEKKKNKKSKKESIDDRPKDDEE